MSNRSPGQQVHDALLVAAEAKNEMVRSDKMLTRIKATVYLAMSGTVDERKAKVLVDERVIAKDDEDLLSQLAFNLAKAEAEGHQCRFSEWQGLNATRRAEMNLI
tara:strand:+ start:47 stop:361 length:315 start_codon:yes stop_codon:yes gene_type:complete